MDDNTYHIIYKDTLDAICESRLLDALHSLNGLLCEGGARGLQGELDQLSAEYDMMLSYTRRGLADPQRDTLRRQFLCRAYELVSRARWHHDREGRGYYGVLSRQYSSKASASDHVLDADDLVRLFHGCYLQSPWSKSDYEQYCARFASPTLAADSALTMASAISLSAYQIFDARRLRLLITLSTSDNTALRARALTGMVLICVRHAALLSLFPDIETQLRLLADDNRYVHDMQALQLQLLLSLRTKEYTKKMEDDILPEMMRMAQRIKPHLKKDNPDITDLSELDLNPEWNDKGQQSEAFKKMEELVSMQLKGADTFYSTFRQISSRNLFFNDVASWFIPFTFDHPYFSSQPELYKSFSFIFKIHEMSNTEKYALCLTMQHIPGELVNSLKDSVKNATEATEGDAESAEETSDERKAFAKHLRFYVQDLYRFSHLFISRDEKDNPFKLNLTLTDDEHFRPVLNHPELLRSFADFCFNEKSWTEAATFYNAMSEEDHDAETYEKMGYCMQQQEHTAEALEYYERANLIRPDSAWTLRQMARLYFKTADYPQALSVLHDLEKLDPDNVDTLLRLGECHIALQQPEEAFSKLYKADYLQPDGRALRALAWSSLLTGKYEQANKYYAKIMNRQPSAEDCLNAGHAAWVSGLPSEALVCYQQCLKLRNKDYADKDFFRADAEVLHNAGITDSDMLIMRDALNSL